MYSMYSVIVLHNFFFLFCSFLSESARISLSTTEAILSSFKECFVLILKYNKHNAIKLIDIVRKLLFLDVVIITYKNYYRYWNYLIL